MAEFILAGEAAKLAGVSVARATQYARDRKLPTLGTRYLWTPKDVQDLKDRKGKRGQKINLVK